jgi:hypothetical protein
VSSISPPTLWAPLFQIGDLATARVDVARQVSEEPIARRQFPAERLQEASNRSMPLARADACALSGRAA